MSSSSQRQYQVQVKLLNGTKQWYFLPENLRVVSQNYQISNPEYWQRCFKNSLIVVPINSDKEERLMEWHLGKILKIKLSKRGPKEHDLITGRTFAIPQSSWYGYANRSQIQTKLVQDGTLTLEQIKAELGQWQKQALASRWITLSGILMLCVYIAAIILSSLVGLVMYLLEITMVIIIIVLIVAYLKRRSS